MVGKPLVPMVLLVHQEGVEVQEVEQQVHAQLLLHLPKSPASPQFLRQVLMKMMTAHRLSQTQTSVLLRLLRTHTARAVHKGVAEQVVQQVVLAVQRPPDPVVAAVVAVVAVVVLGLVESHVAMAHLLLLI